MAASDVYPIQKTRQSKDRTDIDHQENSYTIKIVHERTRSIKSDR